MPHLAGKCDCGRKIRFPNHAENGYEWECYRCGKVWTLSDDGDPLHWEGSNPPPPGASGCLVFIVGFGLAGAMALGSFV